jgi:hypothetical protein
MKNCRLILLVFSLFTVMLVHVPQATHAQCAMCSLNAENSAQEDKAKGKGLNDGILFLLAMPFLIAGGVGVLWYKRYRNAEAKSSVF